MTKSGGRGAICISVLSFQILRILVPPRPPVTYAIITVILKV